MRRAALSLVLPLLAACARETAVDPSGSLRVADVLGAHGDADAGFQRATEVPTLRFPADHGPHPTFRTEWWYVTANLDDAQGARFGVQLVFFRQAFAAHAGERTASLAARDLVLAHAAVTDVSAQRFHYAERLARLAGGLAEVRGGTDGPLHLACDGWTATATNDGDGLLPLDLRAGGDAFAFTLRVSPGKPIVLQGDRGLSQKSAAPGNASIYYSLPRLPIAGALTVDGTAHDVHGLAWIDREWSTSALGPDQVGWDWFSLQLDNGEELMWYGLRRADGTIDTWSGGSLIARDGSVQRLTAAQVTATPDGTFAAADGRAHYPARWHLHCASPAFDVAVTPLVADQELHVGVRYWEGAVLIQGTRDGHPVTGRGYLEMTGYAR